MSTVTGSTHPRILSSVGLLGLVALGLLPSQAHAQFVSSTPDPFLGGEVVLTAPTPIMAGPIGYAQVFGIEDFNETGNSVSGGNDHLTYTADFNVTFYTDPTLTTAVGNVTLAGDFDVTLLGRTGIFQTGTFNYTVDMATFSGTVGGAMLQTQLNPSDITMGAVSIIPNDPSPGMYTINAPALVYSQEVVNGMTSDVPALTATTQGQGSALPAPPNSSVPEPSTLTMAGAMASGACFAARRRRRKA